MTAENKHRSAFSETQLPRAPEVPAVYVDGVRAGLIPTEQEAILLYGLRLMQRVSTGGNVTLLERAALDGTAHVLRQLTTDCDDVLKKLVVVAATSESPKSPEPTSRKAKSTPKARRTPRKRSPRRNSRPTDCRCTAARRCAL